MWEFLENRFTLEEFHKILFRNKNIRIIMKGDWTKKMYKPLGKAQQTLYKSKVTI